MKDRWYRVMIVLPRICKRESAKLRDTVILYGRGSETQAGRETVDGRRDGAHSRPERLINSPSDRSRRRRPRDEISDSTVRMTEAATMP